MNNLVRVGLAGLSLALAGAALADGKPGLAEFGSVDQNRDGRVSKAEAQAYSELTSQFATLDADRDSYLSQIEFRQMEGRFSRDTTGVELPGVREPIGTCWCFTAITE